MTGAIVTITGRLTADPVLRHTANGLPVANFTVAHTARKQNAAGDWEDDGEPLFLRVTAWRDQAENAAASLHKGDLVTASGRLGVRTHTSDLGVTYTDVTCQADTIAVELQRQTVTVTRAQASAAA